MNEYPPALSLILVAIIPSFKDLEIARLLGWYRMPLRCAPKIIEVDYLAFYQTSAFGEERRWRIESIAEVRGHELTTRRELLHEEPDHPRAHEEYYKIQLGELQRLPKPILAGKWRRITFIYTTGALLRGADCINDLVVKDDERDVLWRSLRERALRGGRYGVNELAQMELDTAFMAMLGMIKGILETGEEYDAD